MNLPTGLLPRLACAALTLLLASCELEAQQAAPLEPDRVVAEAIEACNDRRIEAYVRAYDPDAVIRLVDTDAAVDWLRGADQLRQWAGWTCPRFQIEVLDRFVSDNVVLQRERHWQLDEVGNRTARWTRSQVYLVENGSILRRWRYPDESNDPAYVPAVDEPRYPTGGGPMVYIDRTHANGHTADDSYWPFAELLRRDGYVVRSWSHAFTDSLPVLPSVLVTANAGTEIGPEETISLRKWVERGGGLLLITDHAPFPERVRRLGTAFGIDFLNGFVRDTMGQAEVYRRRDGTLGSHPVTDGVATGARVDSVVTHTGSAFSGPAEMQPLLDFPETMAFFERWSDESPARSLEGQLQGGALAFGRGRVAVFAEAAMFRLLTPMASGSPVNGQNALLARNVIFWLGRR